MAEERVRKLVAHLFEERSAASDGASDESRAASRARDLEAALREEQRRSAALAEILHKSRQALLEQRDQIEELRTTNADLATMASAVDFRIKTLERQVSERDRQLSERTAPEDELETMRQDRERLEAEIAQLREESERVHSELAAAEAAVATTELPLEPLPLDLVAASRELPPTLDELLATAPLDVDRPTAVVVDEPEVAANLEPAITAVAGTEEAKVAPSIPAPPPAPAPEFRPSLDVTPPATLPARARVDEGARRAWFGVAALVAVGLVFWLGEINFSGVASLARQTEPASAPLAGDQADGSIRVPPEGPGESAEALATEAEQAFEQGNLTGAAAAAVRASQLDPSARNFRLLGYVYAALGSESEATASFAKAAALEPSQRVSLADYHLARAWVDLEAEMRRRPDDPALAERLRALAAVAEMNPELRAMSRIAAPNAPPQAADLVPPIVLTEGGSTALVVEKRAQIARLYEYRGGHLVVAATYPVTTGQATGTKQKRGDRRTPDGVYAIVDLLPGDKLPDKYGALAMPLSYPNAWDKDRQRGGDGIWIHGADNLSAPFNPRGTKGCITMRAEDLRALSRTVDPIVTPVLVAEEITYVRANEWNQTTGRILQHVGVTGLLNLVATPDYIVATRRDGGEVVRQFFKPDEPFSALAHERAALIASDVWADKLAQTAPAATASLSSVRVSDDRQGLVIETSGPAKVKTFADTDTSDRVYVDLEGVRPGVLPKSIDGQGQWVKRVRIGAAELDPPTTRLVVELRRPGKAKISTAGTRTTIKFIGG